MSADAQGLGKLDTPRGEAVFDRGDREGTRRSLEALGHKRSPCLRAIRAKCLDCAQSCKEVRLCSVTDCPLWPFRMGWNPWLAGRVVPRARGGSG